MASSSSEPIDLSSPFFPVDVGSDLRLAMYASEKAEVRPILGFTYCTEDRARSASCGTNSLRSIAPFSSVRIPFSMASCGLFQLSGPKS